VTCASNPEGDREIYRANALDGNETLTANNAAYYGYYLPGHY
jgi:hypothetical protein